MNSIYLVINADGLVIADIENQKIIQVCKGMV
jgi:hypothetical protein